MRAEASRGEAVVVGVGFDVAHDTEGLLVVTLRFPSGALSRMQLAGAVIGRVVKTLGLETVSDLVGRPFSELAPALQAKPKRTIKPRRTMCPFHFMRRA